MSHLRNLFERLQWHHLVPDIERSLVIEGCGAEAEFTPAAYAADGSVAIIYVPTERSLEVNTRMLSQSVKAYWFDPTNGSISGMDASPCRKRAESRPQGPILTVMKTGFCYSVRAVTTIGHRRTSR